MGLFSKRPLSMFCFLFLFVSLLAFFYSELHSVLAFIIIGVIFATLFVLSFFCKKFHVKIVTLCICFMVVFSALLHSFLFVRLPQNRAKEYVGEKLVLCRVIDDEYYTDDITLYHVKVQKIDGKDVNIKGTLMFSFDVDVAPGDEIYAIADISLNDSSYSKSEGNILSLYIIDAESCYVKYSSRGASNLSLLFSNGGARIISDKIGDRIGNLLNKHLGEEMGVLSLGFFTGIRENISSDVTRDFRRAGVSHIMAVSGSHIAILLGGIELLLRKLRLKKLVRCILVSLCGIAFMFITGFSLSGCRSVLMLYAVYLGYLMSEDYDSITSLFVSISLIVLIAPFSIVDLGMWMSFIATLGLLTAYPVFEERIPYPRKKKGIIKGVLQAGRALLLLCLMTLVANAYLLPISWYFFGEFSLVSLISNILIGWISSLFMMLILAFLLCCNIPGVSLLVGKAVTAVGNLILCLVRFCARIPNATVSLKYGFCTVIMILFIISMAILLGIKLKHKSLIVIPFIAVLISFSACFAITNMFFSKPKLEYISRGSAIEIISISEKNSISFCEVSRGEQQFGSWVIDEVKMSSATEIESLVLMGCGEKQHRSVDVITGKLMVRKIYLPMPTDDQSAAVANSIYQMASERGSSVCFYNYGDIIEMTSSVKLNAYKYDDGVTVGVYCGGYTVGYTTPCHTSLGVKCDALIIGGKCEKHEFSHTIDTEADEIIFSSEDTAHNMVFENNKNLFIAKNHGIYRKAVIELYK